MCRVYDIDIVQYRYVYNIVHGVVQGVMHDIVQVVMQDVANGVVHGNLVTISPIILHDQPCRASDDGVVHDTCMVSYRVSCTMSHRMSCTMSYRVCMASCTTTCMTTGDGIVEGIVQGVVQGFLHDFVHGSEITQVHVRGNSANPAGSCRMGMTLLPVLQDFFTWEGYCANIDTCTISCMVSYRVSCTALRDTLYGDARHCTAIMHGTA